MLRKSIFFLFSLFVFAVPAFAIEEVEPQITRTEKPVVTQIKKFEMDREKIFSQNLKEKFAEKKASAEAKRMEIKTLLEQKKKITEQQKTLLKNKLQTFRDENKKELVLKLDERIASISSKRTEKMNEAVNKLTTVLDSIKSKANQLDRSCETTNLTSAITKAEEALTSASAAVELQAKKSYPLNITDESTAKENVGSVLKQLQTDLRNTHKAVMDAKKAIVKAAVELNKTKRCANVSVTPLITNTVTPTVLPEVTLTPTTTVTEE